MLIAACVMFACTIAGVVALAVAGDSPTAALLFTSSLTVIAGVLGIGQVAGANTAKLDELHGRMDELTDAMKAGITEAVYAALNRKYPDQWAPGQVVAGDPTVIERREQAGRRG